MICRSLSINSSIIQVFSIIGGMEYAYLESPPSMKCVVMGVFYMVNAIGDILSVSTTFPYYLVKIIEYRYSYVSCWN